MAFHDDSHLGRVSSRQLVVGGIEMKISVNKFQLINGNKIINVDIFWTVDKAKFLSGELQYSNSATRLVQRMDPDAAWHQRAPLHRASGGGSALEIGDREEGSRGAIVSHVTTILRTLDTFISRDVHATSLIV